MNLWTFLYIINACIFSQTLYCAAFQVPWAEDVFFGFRTIEPEILAYGVEKVPEQTELWSCGLHQCGHAYHMCMKSQCKKNQEPCEFEEEKTINYKTPEEYPLSVDINIRKGLLGSILNRFNLNTDENGFFKVGATPHEMAHFINNLLPDQFPYQADPFSTSSLTVQKLRAVVEANIEKNLPTIAYYVEDKESMLMHVVSITGYLEGEEGLELMILDTQNHLNGFRFYRQTAVEFVNGMDASSIVNTVMLIDEFGGFVNLRSLIAAQNGRVVSQDILKKWKSYSLIQFVEK